MPECLECGEALVDLSLVCTNCGFENESSEIDEDEFIRANNALGPPMSGGFKRNAYQKRQFNKRIIFEEYCTRADRYALECGFRFPASILRVATEIFNRVQEVAIMRASKRHMVMAACLFFAGKQEGFFPSEAKFAGIMELETRGIKPGIRKLQKLKIVDEGSCEKEATLKFALESLKANTQENRIAVKIMCYGLSRKCILHTMTPRTFVLSVVHFLFSRLLHTPINLQTFCSLLDISPLTIRKSEKVLKTHEELIYKLHHVQRNHRHSK